MTFSLSRIYSSDSLLLFVVYSVQHRRSRRDRIDGSLCDERCCILSFDHFASGTCKRTPTAALSRIFKIEFCF